jgi:hypothetical protein
MMGLVAITALTSVFTNLKYEMPACQTNITFAKMIYKKIRTRQGCPLSPLPSSLDAAIPMLHCGDEVLGVMRGVGLVPDIAFSLMAKKLHSCLI